MDDTSGTLDEALERLHSTGPERAGWLSNHAPMAVEALVKHGQAATVHGWLDYYRSKLEDRPQPVSTITEATWHQALGDPRHLTDWADFFGRQMDERPWREVLVEWWPRLLPGLLASATHPLIRVGHAVRTLLDDERAAARARRPAAHPGARSPAPAALVTATPPTAGGPRLAELAEALGYWAARYQPLPVPVVPAGTADPEHALAALPRLTDPQGGILDRIARLPRLPRWPEATAALYAPEAPDLAYAQLSRLVRSSAQRYATHGHGDPIMLVHAATAPNAVLRTLPALPQELWAPSLRAVWPAVAAIMSIYQPAAPAPAGRETTERAASMTPEEVFAHAAAHGDEHVIKFADTVLDVVSGVVTDGVVTDGLVTDGVVTDDVTENTTGAIARTAHGAVAGAAAGTGTGTRADTGGGTRMARGADSRRGAGAHPEPSDDQALVAALRAQSLIESPL
ncbi:questin oxidase family protein [Streptomyces sp. 796.1]|uniref:questin oxidase family protein n=1 Tax=Streptomyces sp. 796.1 TaxID=3163029 RepID=UPI0039C8D80D